MKNKAENKLNTLDRSRYGCIQSDKKGMEKHTLAWKKKPYLVRMPLNERVDRGRVLLTLSLRRLGAECRRLCLGLSRGGLCVGAGQRDRHVGIGSSLCGGGLMADSRRENPFV